MNRRGLLAVLGGMGASGCLRLADSENDTSGGTGSTSGGAATAGASNDRRTDTESLSRELSVSTAWPQFQYDKHNTGHHPETTAPTDPVDRAWTFERRTSVPDHRDRENGDEWQPFIPVVADGSVYVSSQDDNVYAIDAATGEEQWRFSRQTETTDPSRKCTPAVANGVVLAEGPGGQFYAVDAATGEQRWRRRTVLDATHVQPTVDEADDVVYYEGRYVFAIETADGSLRWARDDLGWTNTVTVGDGKVFIGQGGPSELRVYALDGQTGETIWSRGGPSYSCTFVDGVVYTTSAGDTDVSDGPPELFAIAADDGTILWRTELEAQVTGFHPPTVAAGRVFVGTEDGNMYVYDAENGGHQWTYRTVDNSVQGTPVVADGHVFFSTAWDGAVHCGTADDGTRKWTYPIEGAGYAPIVVDDVVIFGDNNGRVHALTERN